MATSHSEQHLSFELNAVKPFRLDYTVWALRRRANNAIDRWTNKTWERALLLMGQPAHIAVTQNFRCGNPLLQVVLQSPHLSDGIKKEAMAVVKKCFGTSHVLTSFYEFALKDEVLNSLATRFMGLKPPIFPSVFEAAVNGIACQQVSLNLGIILLNRLALAYGVSVKTPDGVVVSAFPRPEDLFRLKPEDFRKLGFSHQKGRAIIELSESVVSGGIDLERMATLSNEQVLKRLCDLRGFGRWTAQYVLLRGLGRVDVFPADDVGGRRGLQRFLKIDKALDYEEARSIVAKWEPYGGLIYFHLLLNRLSMEGYLDNCSS